MLTDIFAYRYLKHSIWTAYTETERRLLKQTVSLAKEVFRYYSGTLANSPDVKLWFLPYTTQSLCDATNHGEKLHILWWRTR